MLNGLENSKMRWCLIYKNTFKFSGPKSLKWSSLFRTKFRLVIENILCGRWTSITAVQSNSPNLNSFII